MLLLLDYDSERESCSVWDCQLLVVEHVTQARYSLFPRQKRYPACRCQLNGSARIEQPKSEARVKILMVSACMLLRTKEVLRVEFGCGDGG